VLRRLVGRAPIYLVVVVAACTLIEPEWVESTVDGRVFRHPVTWQVQLPQGEVLGGPHFHQLFYLGNVTVGPECIQERLNEFRCGVAIPPLEDDDVIISWGAAIGMGAGLLGRGDDLVIDRHQAQLQVSDDPNSSCEGADVAASVKILTSDHSNDVILFCSRGVSQQEALAAFRRFADSIDIGRVGPRLTRRPTSRAFRRLRA
jgi:hypothetical protein